MNLSTIPHINAFFKQVLKLKGLALFTMLFLFGCVSQTTAVNTPSDQVVVYKEPDLNEAAEQRLNLGLQYLQNGQIERAKHHLDKALQHAPNKASVQVGHAYYYEQVKEYKRARNYYMKALRMEPRNGDYLNLFGSFLCNQGDYSEAEKYFKKSVKQLNYANVTATYENSGVCAMRAGNFKLAEASFRTALDHDSNSSISLLEMSEISYQKQHYLKARAFLSRHFSNAQVSAKSLWLGIKTERVLGDDDALSTYALKLKGMFPGSDETQLYLDSIKL